MAPARRDGLTSTNVRCRRYALLMLVSTVYSWRVEKGTVFVGKKKSLVDGRVRLLGPVCYSRVRTRDVSLTSVNSSDRSRRAS